jgi:dATP pyrophosphohydrolase
MKLPIQVDVILYHFSGTTPRYLLLKRTEERGGFWQPVTGGVHEGEELIYAARREVMEETGYLKVNKMLDLHYSFEFKAGEKTITEHVFAFEVPHKELVICFREHEGFCWVSYEEAMTLLKWDTNREALTRVNSYLVKG